ncbi:MAG: MFS transporter [Alphaproteobacteria bacterium]|jgi:MFS transporter, DHA1 family, tetracycline resistance protein|nr:MFS transporter [Rhodospirillaceae bacterium]MBT6509879.1 MFS transporter [Rhodospirillaceae bacterium]MBT7611702.1 MFS transporter [Rhodospirillaceae bacterium]MBT7646366.1 MFS transporter [Rhodospirillaceae bacterium]MDG2482372.1 MFS transporter [Alphaproteobacteria bacterium]
MTREVFRLSPLLLVILIDTIGYSIIVPVLAPVLIDDQPTMMASYSAHARYIVYGVAIGVYELVMLYMAPVLGEISDRAGRRPVLVLSIVGIILSFLMIGFSMAANLVFLLILGRIIGGATAGSQAVAQAAAVDRSTPDTKAMVLSLCLFASSVGFILGPVLGGVLANGALVAWFDSATPLYAVALLALFSLFLLLATEPRSERASRFSLREIDLLMGLKGFKAAFADKYVRGLVIVFTLMQIAWGAFFLFVPSLLINRFDFDGSQIAMFMAVLGVGFCIAYGAVLPLLSRKFPVRSIAAAGLWLTSVLLAVSIWSHEVWLQWAIAIPIATTVSVAYGAIITMFSDSVTPERQGWILGITISVTAFAWGFASIVSGVLSGISYVAPLIMALVTLTLSSIAIHRMKHLARAWCGNLSRRLVNARD